MATRTTKPTTALWERAWKEQPQGQGKSKRAAVMIPKELQGRDNVSIEPHGRRLCFEFNLGCCTRVPNGGESTEAFTCDVGVTLRILKQNIQARTKGLASPLDYMKGFAKLPTRAHHRLIV
jgi:hypothetical protein